MFALFRFSLYLIPNTFHASLRLPLHEWRAEHLPHGVVLLGIEPCGDGLDESHLDFAVPDACRSPKKVLQQNVGVLFIDWIVAPTQRKKTR